MPLVQALKEEIFKYGVLHADESPVAMLSPGDGKTHRSYIWAYAPGQFEDMKAVIYDFCESRAGPRATTAPLAASAVNAMVTKGDQ